MNLRVTFGKDIFIALDPATSEFYENGAYNLRKSGAGVKTSDEMIALWEMWADKYPICSIEDGLAENDWDGWKKLTEKMGSKIQLVGDDLLVTNVKFLKRAIDEKSCNAILVKVNQIGTLTEAKDAVEMAKKLASLALCHTEAAKVKIQQLQILLLHGKPDRSKPAQLVDLIELQNTISY